VDRHEHGYIWQPPVLLSWLANGLPLALQTLGWLGWLARNYQEIWHHSLPKTTNINETRVNLTINVHYFYPTTPPPSHYIFKVSICVAYQ